MKMAYMAAHTALQATIVTLVITFLTFLQMFISYGLYLAPVTLSVLVAVRIGVYMIIVLLLRVESGLARDGLALFIVSFVTALIIAFTTGMPFDTSWLFLLVLLASADISSHIILRLAGARPGGQSNE